jgi:hypothetical protein
MSIARCAGCAPNWETMMPTVELSERLRARAAALDEATRPITLNEIEPRETTVSPPASHRGKVVLAAAAAILVVGGAAIALRVGNDNRKHPIHVTGPSSTLPPEQTSTSLPASSSTPSRSNSAPQNLVTTNVVRSALVTAFATGQHLPVAYVQGTVPGSVYYAYDPETHTFWALAQFSSSDAARLAHDQYGGTSKDPYVQFQDGPFIFKRTASSQWNMVGDTGGLVCAPRVPAGVLAVWGIEQRASCP